MMPFTEREVSQRQTEAPFFNGTPAAAAPCRMANKQKARLDPQAGTLYGMLQEAITPLGTFAANPKSGDNIPSTQAIKLC